MLLLIQNDIIKNENGEINTIIKQFPDSAVALSLLHSNGQLEWLDPFHYSISSQ